MKMWEQQKNYKKFLESLKTNSNKKQRFVYDGITYVESSKINQEHF